MFVSRIRLSLSALFLWVCVLHSIYTKTAVCHNVVKTFCVCVRIDLSLNLLCLFSRLFFFFFTKLYTIAATPYYGVMEGFISWFPEENHCKDVSSYLYCSSLTKPLEKPTHPCFFFISCLFGSFVLTGCQHCAFVFSRSSWRSRDLSSITYKTLLCLCIYVTCTSRHICLYF